MVRPSADRLASLASLIWASGWYVAITLFAIEVPHGECAWLLLESPP